MDFSPASRIIPAILLCFCLLLPACAGKSRYADPALAPEAVLSIPEKYSDNYGYLFLTHDKVMGNPVLSHWVMDNCRYAGTFYSATFILVKLVPGTHVIRVVRPADAFHDKRREANRARLVLNIRGGEILVYDNHIGWKTGMALKEKTMDLIDGFAVSKDCVDCSREPDARNSLSMDCFENH